ncbi:MAG: threonine synthase [Planctomycetota bacterium]|jgi:threonine synthase
MKYISTRGGIAPIGFMDAVLMGLADDGGLIVPETIPDVRQELERWSTLSYIDLAIELIGLYATDLPKDVLDRLVRSSYSAFPDGVAPTVQVGRHHILELWHGPTLAFKDVALQFLGNVFEYILEERDQELNILGATSGDTGSAAIYGVRGKERINIFIMHPHQRVSPVQERQMTTVLDENVFNIALEGSFDDCQTLMKTLASDLVFKQEMNLGAVNSVNWARVLAQIVYYFKSGLEVMHTTGATEIQFSVPTGNFGDILAGFLAARMGLPVKRLLLATNENDILCRFFTKGDYSIAEVAHTLSPSMDIQVASNFERYLYYRVGECSDRLKGLMDQFSTEGAIQVEPTDSGVVDPLFLAGRGDREATLETIKRVHATEGYLLDPHTAVGVHVANQLADPDCPTICLATAHPAKFAAAIGEATGDASLACHPAIDHLADLETRSTVLPNDSAAIKDFMIDALSSRG